MASKSKKRPPTTSSDGDDARRRRRRMIRDADAYDAPAALVLVARDSIYLSQLTLRRNTIPRMLVLHGGHGLELGTSPRSKWPKNTKLLVVACADRCRQSSLTRRIDSHVIMTTASRRRGLIKTPSPRPRALSLRRAATMVSETAQNRKRDHPRPRLMDTSRVDGVKAPQHRGTPRSCLGRDTPRPQNPPRTSLR